MNTSALNRLRWLIPDINAGLFLVIILSVIACLPLAANPAGLPNGDDVLYHTYRAAAMQHSWENGIIFPRWADIFYHGYGSPIWNFYAPLTYYVSAALQIMFGWSALMSLRVIIVLAFVGAGTGMYLFMQQQAGRLAGVLSAAAYVFSPYILFTLPYARGAYPELLALSLFPFVMWHFGRLLRNGRGRDLILPVLTLFLLILTHNLLAVTLSLLLVLWLLVSSGANILVGESGTLRRVSLALVACVIGVGLAAYFWLPVLLESDTVHLQNLTGVALLEYHDYFVPLHSLISFVPVPDTGAVNGLRRVTTTGIPQVVLAISGLITATALIFSRQQVRRYAVQSIFFGLFALLCLFLITPASVGLWDGLRPLQMLQFPWRLLGPLAFALSVLAGMNALWLMRLRPIVRGVIAGAALMALMLLAAPSLVVMEWTRTDVDESISAYHASESAGLQIATTFTDEFRPASVNTPPGPAPDLVADYADGYPVDRASVPDSVQTALMHSSPQANTWLVSSEDDFTMEVFTFDWAGWTAEVNGERVPITPSPEHGLITFPVPAGESDVRVYLTPTPARVAGNVISVLSLLALAGLSLLVSSPLFESPPVNLPEREPLTKPVRMSLSISALVSFVLLLGLTQIHGIAWLDTPPGNAPASNAVRYELDDTFAVLGYDINTRQLRAGDALELVVYWYGMETSDVNFSSFVHIGKPDAPPVAQADKLHPGGRAIPQWWGPERGYIYDEYRIQIPANVATGEYQLYVGLYTCELMPPGDCGNGYRPQVTDADDNVIGDRVPLGSITIVD